MLTKKKPRNGLIAALDVGSTKIACFIAKQEPQGPRVIGIGHQVSRGVRNGAIVDLESAEASILNAVSAAEQMAGESLETVIVNTSGGAPESRTVKVEVALAGHEIGDADLRRVLSQGRAQAQHTERQLLHAIPAGFTIDGSRGIKDPRGMFGDRLGVNMHLVTADTGAVRNLAAAIGRCRLDVEDVVVSAYAAGLGVLVGDELELGATLIDMGGGTTTVAVFLGGDCIHTDMIRLGGMHVTNDIVQGLNTPLIHAERMKTLYGSALASPADEREIIDVPLIGEDEHAQANHVPKSILTSIIQPRLEETFELVRARLATAGFDRAVGRRVVLTGGASQLQGVRDLAGMVLDKQVRLGRPVRLPGLADQTAGPAFATCAGLVAFSLHQHSETLRPTGASDASAGGWFARVGLWLRENL
jgi:cell division protein FtsA